MSIAGNQNNPARSEFDWYPTHKSWTHVLLRHQNLPNLIYEPCAGDGSMSNVLSSHGHTVIASDIAPRVESVVSKDAMNVGPVECVVTNPPYREIKKLIPYWLGNTEILCLLLRLNYIEGKTRIDITRKASKIIVIAGRMIVFDKVSQFPHAWFIWDKAHTGKTELVIDTP